MESFDAWIRQSLGVDPALRDAVVIPLFAFAVLWLARRLVLAVVWRLVESPSRRRLWQYATFYLALLAGLGVFGGLWLRSVRRVAELVGTQTRQDASQVEPLLRGGVHALLATALLGLVLHLIWRSFAAATRRLDAWCERAPQLRLQKVVLLTQSRIRDLAVAGLKTLRVGLVALLLYFYLPLLFSLFPLTARWGSRLLAWVLESASGMATALVEYLPNLVSLILILLVVRYVMRFVRFLMAGVGRGDIVLPGFDPEWADPTYKLSRVVAGLLTMVLCYPLLPGAGSEVFQGFSIFVGALVTFGSTAVVGNVISGIVLTYTKSFRIRDRVQIGETVGDVLEKTLFVTRLRTIKNEVVTIPNGVVLGGRILNFSAVARERGLILSTAIGIGYDVEWRRVHELLLAAGRATDGVLEEPEPFVWQKDLGDFAVTYELNVHTATPDRVAAIHSELRRHILDGFNRAGIEIMTPAVTALRDANQPAIPPEHHPSPSDFPGFRFMDRSRPARK